jgi:hypothetical protein
MNMTIFIVDTVFIFSEEETSLEEIQEKQPSYNKTTWHSIEKETIQNESDL